MAKLGDAARQQLKKKRLVHQMIDHEVVVFVAAVDRHEPEQAYRKAAERLK